MILIVGATGFVGYAITKLLIDTGMEVMCAGRDVAALKKHFPHIEVIYCDFLNPPGVDFWLTHLKKVDVIINCVGIFYHRDKATLWDIHFFAAKALYEAAQYSGVQQIIHFSALGVDHYDNEYARSKKAIEEFLKSLAIAHVIIRPSVIYGPGSSGSMSLLKILASLPFLIPLPGDGTYLLQPIEVRDVANAVRNLILHPPAEPTLTLAAVSFQKKTLKELLISIRQWLGFSPTFFIKIPFIFIQIMAVLGDICSCRLINTPALKMLKQGNYTSNTEALLFQKITGVKSIDFNGGLNRTLMTKEERWASRLVLLRPLLRISLAILWLCAALTSILPYAKLSSYGLLSQIGIASSMQPLLLYGASGLNFLIGIGLLFCYKIKLNCWVQWIVILVYSMIITFYLPYLWLEPFGPIVKNIPLFISIGVLYILES